MTANNVINAPTATNINPRPLWCYGGQNEIHTALPTRARQARMQDLLTRQKLLGKV